MGEAKEMVVGVEVGGRRKQIWGCLAQRHAIDLPLESGPLVPLSLFHHLSPHSLFTLPIPRLQRPSGTKGTARHSRIASQCADSIPTCPHDLRTRSTIAVFLSILLFVAPITSIYAQYSYTTPDCAHKYRRKPTFIPLAITCRHSTAPQLYDSL